MLINFRVRNFLSFEDLSEISMVKGTARKHENHVYASKKISLLRLATIYGANASGKSNLVEAIRASSSMILNCDSISQYREKYCKINLENLDRETAFEYELLINDKTYSYGFSVLLQEERILKEWLYEIKGKNDEIIFTRQLEDEIYINEVNEAFFQMDEADKLRLDVYMEDLNSAKHHLFINEVNNNKKKFESGESEIFEDIYNWFSEKLEVISPTESLRKSGLFLFKKKESAELVKFLRNFGTGITDIKFVEIGKKDMQEEIPLKLLDKILADYKKSGKNGMAHLKTGENIYKLSKNQSNNICISKIYFIHNDENSTIYSLGEESDGTKRIIDIYNILSSENDGVYIVDEIDRSLHPNLSFKFIEDYLQKGKVNEKLRNQLIVTTHEDRLLDLTLLRRDEIWFVEKNNRGASKIYSLEVYKERFDKDIQSAYLDGRYGSIPKILTT
ncbi:AAA family ATPase [Listeria rustica]|uniref:AAA family ATPase n=1 Tax=Listeria rustica TaxID=2713503 RepID=A0A7W1T7T5_9LIST|nr:AAA family ATPase [Listeria rustica]MBA3927065.1 AAA family ATPase [Listeria rustica]